MRVHILEDNTVVNTVIVNALDDIPGAIPDTGGGIGWKLIEGVLTPPEPVEKTPQELREEFKARRAIAVESITVTTQSGKVFDGDETSQTRMARAIIALQAMNVPSIQWVLHNNTAVDVTVAELVEALALSGAAQAALWVDV